MARIDRLMRLIDALRSLPAPVTAQRLATETEISPRQLYRDIATLRAGGALIDGAPGVGYTLTEDPALPPQSFDRLEIEALSVAISSLEGLGDPALTKAGRTALARIIATLPDRQARQAMHTALHAWRPEPAHDDLMVDLSLIREACWLERSLTIRYRDLSDRITQRDVSYGERSLMLLAHCQLRQGYRIFHVRRIETATLGDISFRPRRVALLRAYKGQ